MNTRRILFVSSLCLLLGSHTSLAGERTEREMLAIAQQQLQGLGGTRSAQTIEKLTEAEQYAIYGSHQDGFVVVSRDDRYHAVLAYSTNRLQAESIPCGMQWWLNAISEVMEKSTMDHVAMTRGQGYTVVEPFIKTLWGQGDPYNFLTPEINGQHTPSGCVATAMSQIMKYYTYPAQGKGMGYYTIEGNSSRITEKISGVYKWDEMLDNYKAYELTDEQRLPVATLMKDAGLATHMEYGTGGSGAFDVVSARGFAYNFSYDSLAIHAYTREFYDQDEWMNMVYGELAAKHPILYCGVDPAAGGHAFVFDGVDKDGYIHVNWGWNGDGDGYFDINDLQPKGKSYHFNSDQSMVYGFKCQESPDADEKYQSLWYTFDPYKFSLDGKIFIIESDGLYNFHFLYFYGVIGMYLKNLDGDSSKDTFKVLMDVSDEAVPTYNGYTGLNNSLFLTGIKAGNYRVYLASKATNEDYCQPIRVPGGALCYDLTINTDGSISLSEAKFMPSSSGDPVTGIHATKVKPSEKSALYDLYGRKVNGEPQKHGVYIQDGKKVIK